MENSFIFSKSARSKQAVLPGGEKNRCFFNISQSMTSFDLLWCEAHAPSAVFQPPRGWEVLGRTQLNPFLGPPLCWKLQTPSPHVFALCLIWVLSPPQPLESWLTVEKCHIFFEALSDASLVSLALSWLAAGVQFMDMCREAQVAEQAGQKHPPAPPDAQSLLISIFNSNLLISVSLLLLSTPLIQLKWFWKPGSIIPRFQMLASLLAQLRA